MPSIQLKSYCRNKGAQGHRPLTYFLPLFLASIFDAPSALEHFWPVPFPSPGFWRDRDALCFHTFKIFFWTGLGHLMGLWLASLVATRASSWLTGPFSNWTNLCWTLKILLFKSHFLNFLTATLPSKSAEFIFEIRALWKRNAIWRRICQLRKKVVAFPCCRLCTSSGDCWAPAPLLPSPPPPSKLPSPIFSVFAAPSEIFVWEFNSECNEQFFLTQKNMYFLGFSRVVTGICSQPCSCCKLAEYNLALNKYEGFLTSKFP